eukprot:scaffold115748_cov60-Phaeocystis_antarctica.AAC.1
MSCRAFPRTPRLTAEHCIAQRKGPLYGVSCPLVAAPTGTQSKQQLGLLCRGGGCVWLRVAACGCVRLRAAASGARTGACWCPPGGRAES